MYFGLLQMDLTGRDLSSLRVGVSGGAAIPGETIRAFEEKFPGVVILEGYGLSESSSTTTFNVSAEQRKVLSDRQADLGRLRRGRRRARHRAAARRGATSARSSSAATTS
jgi:acyl-CoA synthetase (AMP-forming)/AMP-acid ligase II